MEGDVACPYMESSSRMNLNILSKSLLNNKKLTLKSKSDMTSLTRSFRRVLELTKLDRQRFSNFIPKLFRKKNKNVTAEIIANWSRLPEHISFQNQRHGKSKHFASSLMNLAFGRMPFITYISSNVSRHKFLALLPARSI